MALGKTAVENYEHIWSQDPALDRSVPDFDHRYSLYMDDGDESHLPILSGKEPIRWVLRHLPRRVVKRILDTYAGRGHEASFDALAFALVSANGFVSRDGSMLDDADKHRDAHGYERVSDAAIGVIDEELPGVVAELGALIIGKAFPSPKS